MYLWDASLDPFFTEVPGREYFVQITSMDVNCPNGPCGWGWHETPDSYLDDPARAAYKNPVWQNFCPSNTTPCNNLAFDLFTVPEPAMVTSLGGGAALLLLLGLRRRSRALFRRRQSA